MSFSSGNHCSFVLLAEFNIHEGASLRYQFPQPLGVNEGFLAMSMLPDGAETQLDDWTVFFLNQTPWNTIQPVLPMDSNSTHSRSPSISALDADTGGEKKEELLCVLNLVRTKHDKSLQRGAQVLALAICTRHPFIQIFKPVLLMALDSYFMSPSQDCLARLFDAINSMDLSGAPLLTRNEKLVMRACERKDVFAEKFRELEEQDKDRRKGSEASSVGLGFLRPDSAGGKGHDKNKESISSFNSFEEGIMMRTQPSPLTEKLEKEKDWDATVRAPNPTPESISQSYASSHSGHSHLSSPPHSETSFTLGGQAVWVGDDYSSTTLPNTSSSSEDSHHTGSHQSSTTRVDDTSSVKSLIGGSQSMISPGSIGVPAPPPPGAYRQRRSTDASFAGSMSGHGRGIVGVGGLVRDTHFYHTTVKYSDHTLPIKLPLSSFREEVGDYSLIPLLKVFNGVTSGPTHPHLHTNGPQTHPIIVLFNALVTGKRIIFMGHKRPAGEVSSFVLSACALGSGCGAVLRGFIERAFPYANLENRDEWESVPAYIAGVTNPIFSAFKTWDLLCDVKTGSITIASDIHQTYPYVPPPSIPSLARAGTFTSTTSQTSSSGGPVGVGSMGSIGEDTVVVGGVGIAGSIAGGQGVSVPGRAGEKGAADTGDSGFIEDLRAAIDYHYGESLVRQRFQEYVWRFVRIASRYEEEVYGNTKIGWPSKPFNHKAAAGGNDPAAALGAGHYFVDETTRVRELTGNAARIEAWRKTKSYEYFVVDHARLLVNISPKGFDPVHQLSKLRQAKLSDAEVVCVMRAFRERYRGYEGVVELLMYVLPQGGLIHLAFGLFHPKDAVRDATVALLDEIRQYPVGIIFLQTLNHFQRYAYVRQAHEKERRRRSQLPPVPSSQNEISIPVPPGPQGYAGTYGGGGAVSGGRTREESISWSTHAGAGGPGLMVGDRERDGRRRSGEVNAPAGGIAF